MNAKLNLDWKKLSKSTGLTKDILKVLAKKYFDLRGEKYINQMFNFIIFLKINNLLVFKDIARDWYKYKNFNTIENFLDNKEMIESFKKFKEKLEKPQKE